MGKPSNPLDGFGIGCEVGLILNLPWQEFCCRDQAPPGPGVCEPAPHGAVGPRSLQTRLGSDIEVSARHLFANWDFGIRDGNEQWGLLFLKK
jgi:hypothetical protein